jgi:hypothetical protein
MARAKGPQGPTSKKNHTIANLKALCIDTVVKEYRAIYNRESDDDRLAVDSVSITADACKVLFELAELTGQITHLDRWGNGLVMVWIKE